MAEWLFGCVALIVFLSLLATAPLLQLLSLGYLLEAAGRIARSGRLTEGWVGVRPAARAATVLVCAFALLQPSRFAAEMATSARLIAPGSPADRGWSLAIGVLGGLAIAQIVAGCLRGGRFRDFLIPRPFYFLAHVFRPSAYARARDAVWEFAARLRLPYYFWLGLRGFLAGLLWLLVPSLLLAGGQTRPGLGFLGGLLLTLVMLYVPFAQVQMAEQRRFRAAFEMTRLRAHFRRAPLAFLVALTLTLTFALPLYLLKIEIIPREAAWLPSLVFVVFMFPARLAAGWAYGRASRRTADAHFVWRWTARGLMAPVAAAYVLVLFFTQYTSWYGAYSLIEQHAVLTPAPFWHW